MATFSAVKILSTCCRDRGASIEMPPVTIDIVGGHKPMEPEIKMVSLTCRIESGWYRISHYTPQSQIEVMRTILIIIIIII